ncbi:MAG: beta-propeller domain-containing protein [bacterium]|nr:beta-propeller domain-containing protein [bacterium]
MAKKKKTDKALLLILIIISLPIILCIALVIIGAILIMFVASQEDVNDNAKLDKLDAVIQDVDSSVVQFSSEQDFVTYLLAADQVTDYGYGEFKSMATTSLAMESALSVDAISNEGAMMDDMDVSASSPTVQRVSETNVQVANIDEPDLVKTDGKNIFISKLQDYYYTDYDYLYDDYSYPEISQSTKVVNTLPVDAMEIVGEVDEVGELLLVGDMLVVIGYEKIVGVDMSNLATPVKAWELEFNSNTYYQSARLLDGNLYLITNTYIDRYQPCPYDPIILEGKALTIPCMDIYHPKTVVPTDSTFTAMKLNPETGTILDQLSFAAGESNSVIYMSPENMYIAYSFPGDVLDITYDFFATKGSDLVSKDVINRLAELKDYDISRDSQMTELNYTIEEYMASLSADEELRIDNELENRMDTYITEHIRELETTGITRIGLADFSIAATGQVPGVPLNQFSLDEYENHLRVATNIGDNFRFYSFSASAESVNDLYVLDNDLDITGVVRDLGEGERIYSTRFVGNAGYMVTFRETDPFYVFDLSDPNAPVKTGELKIPGYSSYLHPLTDTLVLGVGQEDSKVKLSLFDVSDPSDPQEISKYLLDAYWSDVIDDHHAFLQDADFGVFFLPASGGGYIFSYENNTLSMVKAVSEINPLRALYVNDNLYIVGTDKIVVLSEKDWERVGEMDLR